MKVLIADVEKSTRSPLLRLLEHETDLEILGQATDGLETVELTAQLQPDLLFLDIGMPALKSLDALRTLPPECPQPLVIFVNGYDRQALSTFGLHAIGYLLKPVDPAALSQAVDRARRLHTHIAPPSPVAQVPARDPEPPLKHIAGRRKGRTLLVPVDQIRYFALDQGIMRAHVEDGSLTVNFSFNQLEDRLKDSFFRARREVIVNLSQIREFRSYFKSGILLLMNDRSSSEIIVSERRVPLLRRRVAGL